MTKQKPGILYLDDEPSNLNVFETTFKYDYNIYTTTDHQKALELLDSENIVVVISDQRMPLISGIEFLKLVNGKHPDNVGIILTAYTDIEVVIEAFTDCNIFRYVTKPWDSNDLKLTLDNALENYKLKLYNKDLIAQLESKNIELEEKVKQRTKELVLANNVKSRIFNYISAELGKNINYFSGFLDLITTFDNASDLERSKEHVRQIGDALLNVHALVEKLYRWAAIELGKDGLKKQRCIINNYVQSNLDTLRIPALRRKISLKSELQNDKVSVMSDPSMLNFMISNILISAIQAGEEESTAKVGISRDNGHAVLSVSGSSQKMCDYIDWVGRRNTDEDELPNDFIHYADSELSFMILNEYITQLEGDLKLMKNDNGWDYKVSLQLPIRE